MADFTSRAPRQRNMNSAQRATLTSPKPRIRPGAGAPTLGNLRAVMDVLDRAAAAVEIDPNYAARTAKDIGGYAGRLELLRAALVLVFTNASAELVREAADFILVPALIGLSQGRRETGNIMGTGMGCSDGHDWLRELSQNEGEPLQRIVEAMARQNPQGLYGHPESHNE